MKKKEWIYIGTIVVAFVLLIVSEYNKKEPVDWTVTLSSKDKQPFGAYASLALFKELFNGKTTVSRLPVYNQLTETSDNEGSYIFIGPRFVVDDLDLETLLDFVDEGNNVFIAAESFPENFLDTLKIDIGLLSFVEMTDSSKWGIELKNKQKLFLTHDENKVYDMPKNRSLIYFSKFDLVDGKALGRAQEQEVIDFIRLKYGKGYFYLNANPSAFSNYYVLNKQTNDYAFTALSYLPENQPVIWDEYMKQGRVGEEHILRGILSYPALRWAYYLALAGIVVYIIFEGKRRQRIIPVISPFPNQTVDFVKVIGSLYFNKRNNTDIALKRITYLLEYIRSYFYEQTGSPDEEFIQRIIEKSGCEPALVKQLFVMINKIKSQSNRDWLSDEDLVRLNTLIERFYDSARK
ncbi:MAG: hypothetical protein FWF54_07815 [Candidatus Azobacteroides sp.]|nr:hypothetical protein [Candidatus Azobacteroides sp.]